MLGVMNRPKITLIDYGVGNLLSVQRGLEHCGAEVLITSDPGEVIAAKSVVLPGVGAFAKAMDALHSRGLVEAITKLGQLGTPLLGICLGMQLLLDESEEFGVTKGLGLISGRVVPIPTRTLHDEAQKIPHIGWNSLVISETYCNWRGSILQDITPGEATYFVHSFMSLTSKASHCLAEFNYGGHRIPAVIAKNNVIGCQFHPEKSGEVGLKILRHFCVNYQPPQHHN